MTKYYYTCEEDKRLIEKSFHNIESYVIMIMDFIININDKIKGGI